MPDLAELTADIRRRVADLGFEVVDVRSGGTRNRARLQLRVDRPDAVAGHGITVDECAIVSRALERWLDDCGALGTRYVLEVSSPGIERPVRWPEHWERFTGREIRATLPDRGRVHARIVAVDREDETAVLQPRTGDEVTVRLSEVPDAHLAVEWDALRVHHK